MKALVFDTETTTYLKGVPFSKFNKLVVIGWKCLWKDEGFKYAYVSDMWEAFYDDLCECTHIVWFNLKFDLNWLRSLGSQFPEVFQTKRLWDCQLGEYIISRQRWVYPSLDESCAKRGGPKKLDVVKEQYWDQGINTDAIPRPILTEYLKGDVECTEWLYQQQTKLFQEKPQMFRIFHLSCDDLKVLEEMQANGIKIDTQLCIDRVGDVKHTIDECNQQLQVYSNGVDVNFDSGDHLSAILFGGKIAVEEKVPVGLYKTGPRAGEPKFANQTRYVSFPRLFEPREEWEVAKTKKITDAELSIDENKFRIYFTNDEVLSSVRDKVGIVKLLKTRAKWVKILEYYVKLPGMIIEKGWQEHMIHGNFNQVVTRTGRASSSDPNLQNFAGEIQDVFITRYA